MDVWRRVLWCCCDCCRCRRLIWYNKSEYEWMSCSIFDEDLFYNQQDVVHVYNERWDMCSICPVFLNLFSMFLSLSAMVAILYYNCCSPIVCFSNNLGRIVKNWFSSSIDDVIESDVEDICLVKKPLNREWMYLGGYL